METLRSCEAEGGQHVWSFAAQRFDVAVRPTTPKVTNGEQLPT